MAITANTNVVLSEDKDTSPKDRTWALSASVGEFVVFRSGRGDVRGDMHWMEPDEAITFAKAMLLQATTLKEKYT